MVNALAPLQRIAAGLETTPGTAVAATRLVPHMMGSSYVEGESREKQDEARGVLTTVDDVLTKRMTTLELQQAFDFDLCLLSFLCGVESTSPSGLDTTTTTTVDNASGYAVGDTDVAVDDASGLAAGNLIGFPAGADRFIESIASNTLTLTEGLSDALADNDAVTLQGPPFSYIFRAGVTAARDKDSATFEVLQTDGATNFVSRKFSHGRPMSMALAWADGGITSFTSTWMGSAGSDVAGATIASTTIAARRQVPAALWSISMDDTWASLGNTNMGNVRTLSWGLTTGLTQSSHLRGRTMLDSDGWYNGKIEGKLSMTLDLDAAAVDEITNWHEGDLRFVRLKASNNRTGTTLRSVEIDQCVRIVTPPNLLAYDGEQGTVQLDCELRSDASGADQNFLSVALSTGLSAWAAGALP